MLRPAWLASFLLLATALAQPAAADEGRALAQLERSRLRYQTAEAWARRQQEIRRHFLFEARLWSQTRRAMAPKVTVHNRREYNGYSVENVAIETLPGFYCTGNLYRPLGRSGPSPAILCPHGHFQPLGRFREEQQIRCAQFARMGATVFSYSMVGWQDSLQTTHDDPMTLALQTWNSIRVVDYLSALPGVDPARIGVTGASGGGTQSIYLALVDDRVKAVAPFVIVYPWTEEQGCNCEGGMPVMKGVDTNMIEVSAALSPRPQLIISVGNDPTKEFPEKGLPFIRRMYAIAGSPNALTSLHLPDEAHDYGPTKRRAAYEFFAEHLKLDRLPEDVARITIEPPEVMQVFNDRRALPSNAAQGREEVARAFTTAFPRDDATKVPLDRPLAKYTFKPSTPADEALIFTPEGFDKPGVPARASGSDVAHLTIIVRDAATGQTTPCRINVVGPDGNYYEPKDDRLSPYSLTGQWPKPGAWGNRPEKAPIRYLGRFFYSRGESKVYVPSGTVRVEVWKGLEYAPATTTLRIEPGDIQTVELQLANRARMRKRGYISGDPHIHIPRATEEDDDTIFDLLQAEDIGVGTLLAYNEPPGPYDGDMKKLASPQSVGLGKKSARSRGLYHIISGQEYRSGKFGHLNLFLRDELILPGEHRNADNWPVYGNLIRQVRKEGGVAFYAHGGYAQEIYADAAQGNLDAVELLQFGVYRGIGLADWYRLWNCGFRVPAVAACDFPACRKLGDSITYVHSLPANDAVECLRGAAAGRSFVTTGPLLEMEIDRVKPGGLIELSGPGPHRVTAHVRIRSEVAPVSNVQLVVNGSVVREERDANAYTHTDEGDGFFRHEWTIELDRSSWIAARAYGLSKLGTPNAEAHTNPVSIIINGKAPYERESLDVLLDRIDAQIKAHKAREFPEKARVIAYFERSRDILLKLRAVGGAPASHHPSEIAQDSPPLDDPGRREHTEAELRAFLAPVPPKPIAEVLKDFETVGGFRMELVAKEPMVLDPVAGAFDEDGNLYACEMRDYPYKPKEGDPPKGAVRLLRDVDGDGTFDESHVFADKLLWAAGVAPWKGGVFVAAPPDIWYLKDTDGDHKADVRRKVFTGFGTQNQQAMVNNLQWWHDGKIYGATAGNGGTIRSLERPDLPPIQVDGRDFRFDPETSKLETITGTIQFGNTFDDWGNRFVCSESQPLLHIALPEELLVRNPYFAFPPAIHNLAPPPVPIFRISPIERWRQIRSSRRIAANNRSASAAGASHHVVDAAAGVTVYRGGAYPAEMDGTVFVSDPQNNLIHHRTLEPAGATFRSRRVEAGTEFVRSPDTWFRPVNLINAPDGTLYALDFSREVLESIHIPDDVVKHLDLTSGRDTGRIYRVAPTGFRYPGPPRLGRATTAELVSALESPHGWWRDTAIRLLLERKDHSAVEPLRELLARSKSQQARACALWALRGLDSLDDPDLLEALADPSARVREQALRLADGRITKSQRVLESAILLANDTDPRVRFALALCLGSARDERVIPELVQIAKRAGGDTLIRAAALGSSPERSDSLLMALLHDPKYRETEADIGDLESLARSVGVQARGAEVALILETLSALDRGLAQRLVRSLGQGARRAGMDLDILVAGHDRAKSVLTTLVAEATATAADSGANPSARQSAVELLGCLSLAASRDSLTKLCAPGEPDSVQAAALRALSVHTDPLVTSMLLDHWRASSPAGRKEIVEAMLARPERSAAFLRFGEANPDALASLDALQKANLLQNRDKEVRELAARHFRRTTTSARTRLVAEYRASLNKPGVPQRGEHVFRRECAACHRIGDAGHSLGPDLTSSSSRDAEALLTHILDPNSDILPNYVQYQLADTDGRVVSGLVVSQTAASVTLRSADDRTETIARTNIAEFASTGRSLMPEGFEEKITKPEMTDLIAYLQSVQSTVTGAESPLPIGTEPGLIEPARSR
jgi:putative membrane-bound dehydrogenase-like protein